jgi:hypothetical protein
VLLSSLLLRRAIHQRLPASIVRRRKGGLTRLEGALVLFAFRIARGVVSVEVDA